MTGTRRPARFCILSFCLCAILIPSLAPAVPIVDTGQDSCYDNDGEIPCPAPGRPFSGQDAQYAGLQPSYRDNGDGTVSDQVTGLMWEKAVDSRKVSLTEAEAVAAGMNLAGYRDWRVPNIKELYSLIDFRGFTGSGRSVQAVPRDAVPFIDIRFFDFRYGQVEAGERYIDAQWLSSTRYVGTTMNGAATLFGVNFADGRIKGYGLRHPGRRGEKKFYARYVRGRPYGRSDFVDNRNGTVTDRATGLIWTQTDSGRAMSWQEALDYAESLNHAGFDDWRLPNAKELQSLVDYSRSPDTTGSPAIDPVFSTTAITNEAGKRDFPYFWTSTTHLDGRRGTAAAYVAFGRALGRMGRGGKTRIMDVHGAGSQRSDPKTGVPMFFGPQGDAVRIMNFVRCVRGGSASLLRVGGGPGDGNRPAYRGASATTTPADAIIKGPVTAQTMARPSPGRRFIQRLDRDGDGQVSRSEFDGPASRFSVHDTNADGYISADEAPTGPPPTKRRPGR